MISVRVNEILKYLSSDKKERLKKCVQVMESVQKLDNTRTRRNNLGNAMSLTTTAPSFACVAESSSSSRQPVVERSSEDNVTRLQTTVEEQDKETNGSEKFQDDVKTSKHFKKRRPLTVLKGQNVQCLPNGSSTISENSLSFPTKSPIIPTKLQPQDVNISEGKSSQVSAKFANDVISRTSVPTEGSAAAAETRNATKSQKHTQDAQTTAKGRTKHIDGQKHPKRLVALSHGVENPLPETNGAVVAELEKTVAPKPLSVETTGQRSLPCSGPTLCASSCKSKKQNKNKTLQDVGSVLSGSSTTSDSGLSDFHGKSSARSPTGKSLTLTLPLKDNKLKRGLAKQNGHKCSSGVAELDTFEVEPMEKNFLVKRNVEKPTSKEFDALDTFDDPIVTNIRRESKPSVVAPKTAELDEKWIKVNRRMKRIVVPLSAVSRILGPNGSKLEAICQLTKAHIEREKSGQTNEAVFVLKGTIEQMQAASSVITALVKDCNSLETKQSTSNLPALAKPETSNVQKDQKSHSKLRRSPVTGLPSNGVVDKDVVSLPSDKQPEEDYQESVRSGVSDSAEENSSRSSDRGSSPSQDLLIGEYSLFEHGLGQPLEKLLSCKDSGKLTFARAAASGTSSQTLAVSVLENITSIDQTLLAKAPGYRNAKTSLRRDLCNGSGQKAIGTPNGKVTWPIFPRRGSDECLEEDISSSSPSQFLCLDSDNVHIPVPDCQTSSREAQRSLHSTGAVTLSNDQLVLPEFPSAIPAFSKLNPNAPDFVFAIPHDDIGTNHVRILDQCHLSCHVNGMPRLPVESSSDGVAAAILKPTDVAYSYASNGFEPCIEVDSSPSGGTDQRSSGFALSGASPLETVYTMSVGDGLGTQWICSQESWNSPKVSYGVIGTEQVVPCATSGTYPVRSEYCRSYLMPSSFSPVASSAFNCAFYQQQQQQQQHLMPPSVQSWCHGSQTLAQAGP